MAMVVEMMDVIWMVLVMEWRRDGGAAEGELLYGKLRA